MAWNESIWGIAMKHVAIGVLACLPVLLHAAPTVYFNAEDHVVESGRYWDTDFPLNTGVPIVTRQSQQGYVGPDIYGAMNEHGMAIMNVAVAKGSGLKVRMNDSTGNAVDGLFLFAVEKGALNGSAFSLDAPDIFTSQIQLLASATIRFVVEDSGRFYISGSSGNLCMGGNSHQTDSFRVDAGGARWFEYDPVSAVEGISVVGAEESPAFGNVGFVGFLLQAEGVGQNGGGVNFGVREFVVESKVAPPSQPPSKTLGLLL